MKKRRVLAISLPETLEGKLDELTEAFCSNKSAVIRLAITRRHTSELKPQNQRLSPPKDAGRVA